MENDFGWAIQQIKLGVKVKRNSWGTLRFVFLVPGSIFKVNRAPLLGIYPEGTEINYHGHIDMKTPEGFIMTWIPNQNDMLANDWVVKE